MEDYVFRIRRIVDIGYIDSCMDEAIAKKKAHKKAQKKRYLQTEAGKAAKRREKQRYRKTVGGKLAKLRQILKSKFNITIEQYEELLIKQKGVCALCKQLCPSGKRLCIDHNHITGKVRGLLCYHCNVGLGHFMENAKLLMNAVDYITNNDDY